MNIWNVSFLISFLSLSVYTKNPYYLDYNQLKIALLQKSTKLLWHQRFPAVGLLPHEGLRHPPYTSLPHSFTLHELASQQGRTVRVAFIDTGVAAFSVKSNSFYPFHNDMRLNKEVVGWKTNVIRHNESTTLVELDNPYHMMVKLEDLPLVCCYESNLAYLAGHGTHTMGIVAAQGNLFTGLAPQATSFMIKAFHDNGTTTLESLIEALKIAIFYQADIVNLSLRINASYIDATSKKTIESLFAKIPYVVVAFGNDLGGGQSYPACFSFVDFTVGAFDYDEATKTYRLPSFAQYNNQTKPTVLAPGVDILSPGLAPGKKEGVYVVADGTSAAAACVTGFLALMLGELGPTYINKKKAIVMEIIKESATHPDTTVAWAQASHLGIIDMRLALFIAKVVSKGETLYPLHDLIQCIKEILSSTSVSDSDHSVLDHAVLDHAVLDHAIALVLSKVKAKKENCKKRRTNLTYNKRFGKFPCY